MQFGLGSANFCNIDKVSKRISLSYKLTLQNPWDEIRKKIGEIVKIKITNITEKAIFGELTESKTPGMLHYKEISYNENPEDLKKFNNLTYKNYEILIISDTKTEIPQDIKNAKLILTN